jgi:hypothetical protein
MDSFGPGRGPVAGFCEDGNEPSSYTKGGEFLTSRATTTFSRGAVLHEVSLKLLTFVMF